MSEEGTRDFLANQVAKNALLTWVAEVPGSSIGTRAPASAETLRRSVLPSLLGFNTESIHPDAVGEAGLALGVRFAVEKLPDGLLVLQRLVAFGLAWFLPGERRLYRTQRRR